MQRVPFTDGTLVSNPDISSNDLIPSLLAVSDVMAYPRRCAASCRFSSNDSMRLMPLDVNGAQWS